MLGVFERYPSEEGCGVFWSLLHALESLAGYEEKLVESLQRTPSEFTLRMVHRMLNSGYHQVSGVPLVGLIERIASDQQYSSVIRKEAIKILEWHRPKS
jgi:hypothetical protein